MVDAREILTRLCKYIVEGFVVAVAAFVIPKSNPKVEEVVIIGLTAAATFAILDMFAPSVMVASVKQGVGLGIGASLVGWPAI
jgi:ABC-type Co2+ transport system permease subunit